MYFHLEGMMSKVEALRKAYPTLDIEVIYLYIYNVADVELHHN